MSKHVSSSNLFASERHIFSFPYQEHCRKLPHQFFDFSILSCSEDVTSCQKENEKWSEVDIIPRSRFIYARGPTPSAIDTVITGAPCTQYLWMARMHTYVLYINITFARDTMRRLRRRRRREWSRTVRRRMRPFQRPTPLNSASEGMELNYYCKFRLRFRDSRTTDRPCARRRRRKTPREITPPDRVPRSLGKTFSTASRIFRANPW